MVLRAESEKLPAFHRCPVLGIARASKQSATRDLKALANSTSEVNQQQGVPFRTDATPWILLSLAG